MPGQVVKRLTIAAGGPDQDAMTGTPWEFPDPRGNRITVAAITTVATCTLTVQAGTRIIAEDIAMNVAAAPAMPVVPDNTVASGAALPGERIRVIAKDPAAAGAVVSVIVDLS